MNREYRYPFIYRKFGLFLLVFSVFFIAFSAFYYPFDFFYPPNEWFGMFQFTIALCALSLLAILYLVYFRYLFPIHIIFHDATLRVALGSRQLIIQHDDIEEIFIEEIASKYYEAYEHHHNETSQKNKAKQYRVIVKAKSGVFAFMHAQGLFLNLGDIIDYIKGHYPSEKIRLVLNQRTQCPLKSIAEINKSFNIDKSCNIIVLTNRCS